MSGPTVDDDKGALSHSQSNQPLWAITSYFNPCNYANRRSNYDIFRKYLKIPLVTVELSFTGEYHLQADDAELMIQLTGKDIMWQKERLLNVAIEALPESCTKVAWLDCDIVFENHDWALEAEQALERHKVIQPFAHSYELNREAPPGCFSPNHSSQKCESLARALGANKQIHDLMQSTDKRALGLTPGLAWAARRELLNKHKLYDACIVGGGDGPILSGVLGNFEDISGYLKMNPKRKEHFLDWALPFYREVAGDLGFVSGNIYHLWHGAIKDRNYDKRREGLEQHEFNPYTDIAIDESGCWRWNSHKPELHSYLRDYFSLRMEDGDQNFNNDRID